MTSIAASIACASASADSSGQFATVPAKWRGNAKGAFVLFYDDGCKSTLDFAVPALQKYNVHGTFYLCCGWFEKDPATAKRWFEAAGDSNIFIGNHTWTHSGAKSLEEAEFQIAENDKTIRGAIGLPHPALMSFATPGGVEWAPDRTQMKAILEKYDLITRQYGLETPKDRVGGRTINTAEDAIAAMDSAEKKGGIDSIVFHGVGGDWFKFSAAENEKMIRELAARQARGSLWVPAMIEADMYVAERDSAKVSVVPGDDGKSLAVSLEIDTDPARYTCPLTLVTSVPQDWESVNVEQNGRVIAVPVVNGTAVYDVSPVSSSIAITRR